VITGLGRGGAETALLRLVGAMDAARFEHSVINLGGIEGGMEEELRSLGVAVHSARLTRGLGVIPGMLRLAALLRRSRPHVIQTWMYHANLAALAVAPLVGRSVPVVWNIRSSHAGLAQERPFTRRVAAWNGRFSRRAAAIVNNSPASERDHARHLGYDQSRSHIIPNGFDLEVFRPSLAERARIRAEFGIPGEAPVAGLFARWHPIKGHATFLAAAARVAAPARFLLAGTGVDQANAELSRLVRESGLEGRVHLAGERRDIPSLLAAVDVGVSASVNEGFSNSIGEAMAVGLPCVATDTGDTVWILGGAGVTVPPGDPAAMGAALSQLLLGPAALRRQLGEAARIRVARHFSLPSVARRYEALYDSLSFQPHRAASAVEQLS
jgi:glycosyltransferase involved in cell wall biosynthesis